MFSCPAEEQPILKEALKATILLLLLFYGLISLFIVFLLSLFLWILNFDLTLKWRIAYLLQEKSILF